MATPRDIDDFLLARARRGELTAANTAKGTHERQAVDRIRYLKRRAAHRELTARQSLGHPRSGDVLPTISLMVDDPPRFVIVEGLNRRDTRRAGRYDRLVRELDSGRITKAAFERQVAGWQEIAGFRFLSSADAVLTLVEERRTGDVEVFVYSSGRAP
jgi:hypothetical protein